MTQPLITWDFNPVFFSIGSLDVRYYGLMWALALLIGAWFFDNFVKREGLPRKVSESIFLYGTLATILGARLGHCLFYEPAYYLARPWAIITEFRNGGMASHGAAIGLLIGLWLFSRRNRLPFVWSLDRIMIPVGIGGAIVRLGNLFNSEIVGRVTDLPWGFRFLRLYPGVPVEQVPLQHPTQLYEAVCYLLTFGVLTWLYYKKDTARRHPGVLFGIGLIGVFLTRFFHRVHQGGAGGFRGGVAARYGAVAQHPLYPARNLHDLAGHAPYDACALLAGGRHRRFPSGALWRQTQTEAWSNK